MTDEKFIEMGKEYTSEVVSEAYDDAIYPEQIRMTWYCYLAGNYKAMFSSNKFEDYCEVTYIAKEDAWNVDLYHKDKD